MNNIQILFLVVFALVMLFVFLKLNRKVKLRWTIVSRERVGMTSHVTYDIWDGDRFLDRVHVTKEENGQCYVESIETCTEMAFQFNSLPKDSHVDWAEACLELYIQKRY